MDQEGSIEVDSATLADFKPLSNVKSESLNNGLDSGCALNGTKSTDTVVQAPATTEWLSLALSVPRTTPVSESLRSELLAYAEHIENILRTEKALYDHGYLPINQDTNDLFFALRDGVVLAHLLAKIKPEQFLSQVKLNKLQYNIPWSSLGEKNSKAVFELNAQISHILKAASNCGLVVVNLGSQDILCRKVDLVLGLVWQLMRAHLLQRVNLQSTPELIRLLDSGESIEALFKLNSEQLLLRWVNFHLNKASESKVRNFTTDISSGKVYHTLLTQVLFNEPECLALLNEPLGESENLVDTILKVAEKAGVRQFVTAKDIAQGNPKLNLAFTATIFNKYLGISLPSEDEIRAMLCEIKLLKRQTVEQRERIDSLEKDSSTLVSELTDSKKALEDGANLAEELATAHRVAVSKLQAQVVTIETRASNSDELLLRISASLAKFTLENPIITELSTSPIEKFTDGRVDELPSKLDTLLQQLSAALKLQQNANQTLSTQLAQTQKLNNLMSSKIEQVAESMIEERKKEFKVKVKKEKTTPAAANNVPPAEAQVANSSASPTF